LNGEHEHLSIEQIEDLLNAQLDSAEKQGTTDLLADARHHLADCDACKGLFSMVKEGDLALRGLKQVTPSQGATDCPAPIRYSDLVSGLLDDKESAELIGHASECDRCGPILRVATEQVPAMQAEEAAALASLRSSTPSWQEEFGMKLALAASAEVKERARAATLDKIERGWAGHSHKLTWVLVGLAATIVLVLLGGNVMRSRSSSPDTPGHAEALLATAYTEKRMLALRIPGAQQSVSQIDRDGGPVWKSEMDKPQSLRSAEDLIAKHRNSNDVAWLEARARMELLDGNYTVAIQVGTEAYNKGARSPSLLNDLGVAYFEKGMHAEKTPDGQVQGALDYGTADNYLGEALAKDPKYVVALFNRAIVAKEMKLYTNAEAYWKSYLDIETDPAWKSEALGRLEEVRRILGEQTRRNQTPLDGPTQIVEAFSSGDRDRIDNVDRFADEYLRLAVEQWIPEFISNRPTNGPNELEKALRLLEEDLRTQHGDPWLADFLSQHRFANSSQPVQSLIKAIRANVEGDHDTAIRSSRDAEQRFHQQGNTPGQLFAAFETTYSYRLAAHGKPCYEHAKAVIAKAHERSYVWLEVQSRLEAAACAKEISRIDESVAGSQKALALAKLSKYRNLQLRAVMFAADLLADVRKRLNLVDEGLREFWDGRYDPMRGYSLYALMDTTADDLHLWYWDIAAIEEGLRLIENDPRLSTLCGMERYRLARAQIAIGDFEQARRTSTEARLLLNRGPSKTLQVGATIDLAEALVTKGNYTAALELLDSAAADFSSFTQDVVAAKYYSTRAAALLGTGQAQEAEPVLNTALKLAQRGFASISGERDRLSWSQPFEPVYRAFAHMQMRSDEESSLWWWESFKGASITGKGAEYFDPHLQKLPRFYNWLNDGTILLSYASFSEGVVVWTYDGQHVHSRMLPNPAVSLETMVKAFHDGCADRKYDLSKLRAEGKELYELLIRPVEASLQGKSRLIIETDHALEALPFEALTDSKGDYLGDGYEVEYSAGISYLAQNTRPELIRKQDQALVVGNSLADVTFGLPSLPGAIEEAEEVAAEFEHRKLFIDADAEREQVLQQLPRADVFHFAGHAVGNQQMSALVLSPLHDKDRSRLLDASSFNVGALSRARLVVLSGCSTANGIGIGLSDRESLARNALVAGVSTVVASRWLVDSVSTREWMKVFYTQVVAGRRVSACARQARISLRTNPQWQHPFFWSAFGVFA
jgi:CHAT domain-containing protein/Flp pilus assembly protein TadD